MPRVSSWPPETTSRPSSPRTTRWPSVSSTHWLSAGRRVPDDVSVVGFDDIPEAEFFLPGLTTVRQDFDEVGRRGLDLLVRMLDGSASEHRETAAIAPQLVVRASSASR